MVDSTNPTASRWRGKAWAPILAILLGGALLILALAADYLHGEISPSFGAGQIALATLGALLLAGGFAVLRWRALGGRLRPAARLLAAGYRALASLTLNVLGLFLILELAGMILAGETAVPIRHDQLWRQVPEYASQQWVEQYAQEFSRLEQRYQRYVLWRTAPFAGKTIRVDADGVRRTPGASTAPDALEVFVFGGSAAWGTGSPDWSTIPAHLQRGLTSARTRPVRVTNLAERGYVSTQSLIRLTLELQAGRVPDLVMFYDGYNEVGAAVGSEPGGHFAEARVAGRLDRPLRTWLLTSRTADLVRRLARLRPSFDHLADPRDRDRVAERIVATYLGTYRVVDALSRARGFSYVFFWQPALVASDKPMTGLEEALRDGAPPEWAGLYRRVYQRIAEEAAGRENLFSLAGVLDRETSPLFIDEVHLTPEGNELIAAAMLEIAIPRLAALAP